ncbi:MAG: CHAT domain-containing protein [Chromatiales bacterium]|nr:CHAT domain-containing protein [Chromatiales bacterium]
MSALYDLSVTADSTTGQVRLHLRDPHGAEWQRELDFQQIPLSRQLAWFDLSAYLQHYVEPQLHEAEIARIGVQIAEELLGEDLFRALWQPLSQRTLRVQLPAAGEYENPLAAQLARVPWEIARPNTRAGTLTERNLLVRVVHSMQPPASRPLQLGADECLRVLCVFAEARGSRPLALRREREDLRRLFAREIGARRRVSIDFLSNGVTRERLIDRIRDRGGYHIVHWSGHGHVNLLELAGADGQPDLLSGDELLALFTRHGGGVLPSLCVLSACHSGGIATLRTWQEFFAAARGQPLVEPPVREAGAQGREADERAIRIDEAPGYTGTAHALLQGGVPAVVAMRYPVGDDYARELGLRLYRHLLADTLAKPVETALTLARQELAQAARGAAREDFKPGDVATPVLYGADRVDLRVSEGECRDQPMLARALHAIAELQPDMHRHFVGRTWELAALGSDFIGHSCDAEVTPVAQITGLGGMGKTALAAELIDTHADRFTWVLSYQAKPNALDLDATLRDIHRRLSGELGRYHGHIQAHPADAIHRERGEGFDARGRLDRLLDNLLRALAAEPMLLVFDNFETHLGTDPVAGGEGHEPRWACTDPDWDHALRRLAEGLRGTPSRLLVTSRRPLAALAAARRVALGPLPAAEAVLFVREHPALAALLRSADAEDRQIVQRMLDASRFHPLLLDRLARLAAEPDQRARLDQALAALEGDHHRADLVDLLAGDAAGRQAEAAYLEDALVASLDALIAAAHPDARRLLWMVALGNGPVEPALLAAVWQGGEDEETQMLRAVKAMLADPDGLPPEKRAQLAALPAEVLAALDALSPAPRPRPAPTPHLRELLALGLLDQAAAGAASPSEPGLGDGLLSAHELVRERIQAWMHAQPADLDGLTANGVRLGYAGRLIAVFEGLKMLNFNRALDAAYRAVLLLLQAGAYERLGAIAGTLVISAGRPELSRALVPVLQAAIAQAPEGEARWRLNGMVADALRSTGDVRQSLGFYAEAERLARAVVDGEASDDDGARTLAQRQAWVDLAVIYGNCALALRTTGNLDAAAGRHRDSAVAGRRAGYPEVNIVGSELEGLRIEVMKGRVKAAWPGIEARLQRIAEWWRASRAGEEVAAAPDPEVLARAYVSALDIATFACYARQDWPEALSLIDTIIEVKGALQRPEADRAGTRMNRANVLVRLGRLPEARSEMEACLVLFADDPEQKARTLSSLADLHDEAGDIAQAIVQGRRALALFATLPVPRERAISHNNLANYLERADEPSCIDEAVGHQLAALVYRVVADLGDHLQTSLNNYAIDYRRARASGESRRIPRLAELLADPTFHPLAEWLRERGVAPTELQRAIDDLLDQVRKAVEAET